MVVLVEALMPMRAPRLNLAAHFVRNTRTYGPTSCRARVSAGSLFGAMLPEPPRPVVTTDVFKVGVWRSAGWIWGDLEASAMLPAPPRPVEMFPVILREVVSCLNGICVSEIEYSL